MKLIRSTGGAKRDPLGHWLERRQNVEGPAAARARSPVACGGGKRARRSESTYVHKVDMMMSRIAML